MPGKRCRFFVRPPVLLLIVTTVACLVLLTLAAIATIALVSNRTSSSADDDDDDEYTVMHQLHTAGRRAADSARNSGDVRVTSKTDVSTIDDTPNSGHHHHHHHQLQQQQQQCDCDGVQQQQQQQHEQWPFLPEHISRDPRLIEHVRKNVLVGPSPAHQPYNLTRPDLKDPQPQQTISKEIYPQFLAGVENGTFFEAGALDGETHSTTLYLEREHGWTGLLVEMTPINRQLVLDKHRKAHFAPVCLSPVPWPMKREMKMVYDPQEVLTRWGASISKKVLRDIEKNMPRKVSEKPVVDDAQQQQQQQERELKDEHESEIYYSATVDCYPLYSLLAAAGLADKPIHFMSLDLEGVELQVLQTLPWDLVDVKVLYMDLLQTEEGFAATRDFLVGKGYVHVRGEGEPVIFAKKTWVQEYVFVPPT